MKINNVVLTSSLVGGLMITLTILSIIFSPVKIASVEIDDGGNYHPTIDTYFCKQFKPADGVWEDESCVHNVLTDAGKDHIEGLLGGIVTSEEHTKYLALGNGTAPAAASTTLNAEVATCGLTRTSGTYYNLGTGWWEVNNTFTYSCDTSLKVNTTAAFNASSAGTMLAGGTISDVTFTTNGDQLRLRHNYTISEG